MYDLLKYVKDSKISRCTKLHTNIFLLRCIFRTSKRYQGNVINPEKWVEADMKASCVFCDRYYRASGTGLSFWKANTDLYGQHVVVQRKKEKDKGRLTKRACKNNFKKPCAPLCKTNHYTAVGDGWGQGPSLWMQ